MITASIVLYKNQLEECYTILDCLLKDNVDKIFLIDHSGNDVLAILADYSFKIEYKMHENLGYGSGHNVAINRAIQIGSDYHLIVNADVSFKEGTLGKIVDFLEENQDVAHVMPRVFYPDGELQYLAKLLPTPFDMFVRGFLPKTFFYKARRKFVLAETKYDFIMNVPYLSGCFMFVKTSVLKEMNGFDERFFMYPEDIDLTRRIHEKYKTIFYPFVSIIHHHAAEAHKSLRMRWIMISNLVKYFNKWGWFFDKKRHKFNNLLLKELRKRGISI